MTAATSVPSGSVHITVAAQPLAAVVPGPPVAGAAPQRCQVPKVPPLGVKFRGDPKMLGFFLAQVWNYMQEYGAKLGSETAKVRCITMALKGAVA